MDFVVRKMSHMGYTVSPESGDSLFGPRLAAMAVLVMVAAAVALMVVLSLLLNWS